MFFLYKNTCTNNINNLSKNKLMKKETKKIIATFAAGCFWHVQEAFQKVKGVLSATSGYTGGKTKNPTYEEVCYKETGHAEAVEIIFDAEQISYEKLLGLFWNIHDPTQVNKQGPDVGIQYRSAIFYHSEQQRKEAIASKEQQQKRYNKPIATEIVPAASFYNAEDYHQNFLQKRGWKTCRM